VDKLIVEGGCHLKGTVRASGAKNAALPIMAAALLAESPSRIEGVPHLRDISSMIELLKALGAQAAWDGPDAIVIDPSTVSHQVAPYEIVSTMRASICVLGPLLARYGRAKVSHPGGCVIGPRPVDLHIKGLQELGAHIRVDHGYIVARAERLEGAEVFLGGTCGSSVLATANTLMAATLAKGETVIECAACEPEVVDLADFLSKMGAKISGAGSPRIEVKGVARLSGARHRIIPDRIEAGTYLLAGAMTGGDVTVAGGQPAHLAALIDVLRQAEISVGHKRDKVWVKGGRPRAVNVATHPFPGFPTDLQAQIMALMTIADGISVITEKIYPDRFMHVSELLRMGAYIIREGPRAIVQGGAKLSGAQVMASDLRASAALVLAGLVAKGKTEIHRVYHLDRGYDRLEKKLENLGARVWREQE